ncbi:MAG: hypothetical protein KGY46_10660 [Anaerolineales bacterium]|nr:hypothetical protein [Anaerolineales bacterium]
MSWNWLLYGTGTGLVIWLSQRVLVSRLYPERIKAAKRWVALSAALRWILSAAVLALALEEGIGSGLSAFGGLMSAPWLGILSLTMFPLPDEDGILRRT